MRKHKYEVNYKFFSEPELWEQKQAYFLGWLLSDGHHNIKNGSISIKLQEKDKKILEILKEMIEFNGNLCFMKREKINAFIKNTTKKFQSRWALTIYRRELSDDLIKLKISNNKTKDLKFPDYLKPELVSHFLRGYYEGDGTISYHYNGDNLRFDIHLLGTEDFCKSTINILSKEFPFKYRTLERGTIGEVTQIQFSGRLNALRFFNYIYKDSKFMLKRKFRKFLRLINYMRKKTNFHHESEKRQFEKELKVSIKIAKDIIKNAKY